MAKDVPNILNKMDDGSIRQQSCALCGAQQQDVVHTKNRPDYALCGHCGGAFILEDGGDMRMLYAHIPQTMPLVRSFALRHWRKYFEIRAYVEKGEDEIPSILKTTLSDGVPLASGDHQEAILDLEAEQSDIFYSRQKNLDPPPRRLRETGELPDLDELFKDHGLDSPNS